MTVLAYGVAGWLLLVGLAGIVRSRNLIQLVVCLSVCQASTYVLLLAIGFRTGAEAPIRSGIPAGAQLVDPVVQAMTLTDIVVQATVMALLLALAVRAHGRFGTLDPDELAPMRG
jgi:multicomponent Na+:H+ antiporter subunit C